MLEDIIKPQAIPVTIELDRIDSGSSNLITQFNDNKANSLEILTGTDDCHDNPDQKNQLIAALNQDAQNKLIDGVILNTQQ